MSKSTLNDEHPDFKLSFAIAIIEHLGLNLYSEVHSAVAELLANAYDAEASVVRITVPIGIQLGLTEQKIIIEDNGHGMTYDECRDRYLAIGRNRRRSSRTSKNGKRVVIGKKGIGKLAGFGIANQMHVRTISDNLLTEFVMNLNDIRSAQPINGENNDSTLHNDGLGEDLVREYPPTLIAVNATTSAKNGTTITLEKIRPLDQIDVDDFKLRLSRKFAIYADDFKVTIINSSTKKETEINKFDIETQYRFPSAGWQEDFIETPELGAKSVSYWIGFREKPIRDESVRGISVIANGKSVQDPFYFRLSGGVTGQFGLQYITGEVQAHWLDEGLVDVIASDRASVRWEDVNSQILMKWGQKLLKDLLATWAEKRATETRRRLSLDAPNIEREIGSYSGETQRELQQVVDRVVEALAEIDSDRTKEIVESVVTAYRHDHVRTVLKKIIDGRGDLNLFIQALKEWDLINAVQTYRELTVKAEAIETLRILILGRATEVKSKSGALSLHEHLADYPWLIDPMFRDMESERNLDMFLLEHYGEDAHTGGDDKRADFIVLYDSERIRLVEIKSAKDPLDKRGVDNLIEYQYRVKVSEAAKGKLTNFKSLLIYNGDATKDAMSSLDQIKRNTAEFEIYTWPELLQRNKMIYKEMIGRVRAKNPKDPRVTTLLEEAEHRIDAVKVSNVTKTTTKPQRRHSKKTKPPPGSQSLF